ncbi:MAG: UDP-N-acetylmuramoyl-L-alanine--D-glutamate ligase [Chitinophagales bacterium]|nr:UDP-N-acetylmuramoyl-L-alanine--D-glutamate ligase [Chitinophagales bacterium]
MSKRIVILGGGESGIGAAILAKKQEYDTFLSDGGTLKDKYKTELEGSRIPFEEGGHTEALILNADEVIKSPGIPEKAAIIQQIRKLGIPVISEIEFAYRFTKAQIVAITGTNGKTTTTSLTYHIFQKAGLNVGLAGNIGHSFARSVAEHNYDIYILEISSFQLDDIVDFHPNVAILMNITPDHLDRYNYNLEEYVAAKFKISQNQTADDSFIYCEDDEITMQWIEQKAIQAKKMPFSLHKTPQSVGYAENGQIIIEHKTTFTMSINDLSLRGPHNTYNSLAAGIAARIFDIRKDVLRESLSDFKGVEHRLEFVAKIADVEYINDSKATNVNSSWYALESMTKPVVWIVGGVDKGNDYEVLKPLVMKKVKAIVCLGVNNIKIHEAFSRHVDIMVNTTNAQDAVKMSHQLADKGDVVLLSPCCASFDLFENYEDRGNQFKRAVREL